MFLAGLFITAGSYAATVCGGYFLATLDVPVPVSPSCRYYILLLLSLLTLLQSLWFVSYPTLSSVFIMLYRFILLFLDDSVNIGDICRWHGLRTGASRAGQTRWVDCVTRAERWSRWELNTVVSVIVASWRLIITVRTSTTASASTTGLLDVFIIGQSRCPRFSGSPAVRQHAQNVIYG